MATEAASAEKQARAQAVLNQHVERIAKSIGVAAPPPVRADNKPAQNAAETERLSTFLELVANYVDPNQVTKMQLPQAQGGMGKYNALEEEAKAQKKAEAGDEEPHFRGRPLSSFDAIPDDQLTNEEGIGEATAKDIVKARHARDRKAAKGQ